MSDVVDSKAVEESKELELELIEEIQNVLGIGSEKVVVTGVS